MCKCHFNLVLFERSLLVFVVIVSITVNYYQTRSIPFYLSYTSLELKKKNREIHVCYNCWATMDHNDFFSWPSSLTFEKLQNLSILSYMYIIQLCYNGVTHCTKHQYWWTTILLFWITDLKLALLELTDFLPFCFSCWLNSFTQFVFLVKYQ